MNSIPQTLSLDEVKIYLSNGILAFHPDPPDTKFQSGYKAALEQVYSWICVEEGLLHDI